MTVFVAGVHGVGKSYLCEKYAQAHDVLHESASSLIRKEKNQLNWSTDKKVVNADDNQVALVAAVRRISEQGNSLLLDGHFVLIGPHAEFIRLPPSVFKDLNLTGVILIEASPEIISSRLSSRDDSKSTVDIALFLEAERAHAKLICETLNLPLEILFQPTQEVFADVAKKIIGKI